MDHGHLETEWTGKVSVTPLNRDALERALKAYNLFCGNHEYPPGYKDTLRDAQAILAELRGAQLTATASYEADESVVIETFPVPVD